MKLHELLAKVSQGQLSTEDAEYRLTHFYSPLPSRAEVAQDRERIFDRSERELPGIDLNVEGQLELVEELSAFYFEQPFTNEKQDGLRYYFLNDFFSYGDALQLYAMIRWAKPKRVIEIGSGFSSCVMLDTNELFFDNDIDCIFIDPDVERLQANLKLGDETRAQVIPQRVQDVDLEIFDQLAANDILFIDSSHVAKIGSDVNREIFEILPRIPEGVVIHVHDVFYPFEYPSDWVEDGRAWNEDYLIRAFLQYNSEFRIRLWNDYLARFHSTFLRQTMPMLLWNSGASFWIERMSNERSSRD